MKLSRRGQPLRPDRARNRAGWRCGARTIRARSEAEIATEHTIAAIKMQLRALAIISSAAAISAPRAGINAKGLAVRGGGLDVEQIAS